MSFYGKVGVKELRWDDRFCTICGETLAPNERHSDPWECINRLGEILRDLRREIAAIPGRLSDE